MITKPIGRIENIAKRIMKVWADSKDTESQGDAPGWRWDSGSPADIADGVDYEPDADRRPQWLRDTDDYGFR